MSIKETAWAVTELAFLLPSGETLQLTCAPKYPDKPVYSLEIRKDKTIQYQVDASSLPEIKELLKAFTEGILEFERFLNDATLFDDAINAAKVAKKQVATERANIGIQGLTARRSQMPFFGGPKPDALLGATETETK